MPPTYDELSTQLAQLRTDKTSLERRIDALASEVSKARDEEHRREVLKISLGMLNNCRGIPDRDHRWEPVEFKRDVDYGSIPSFCLGNHARFPTSTRSVKLVCTGCGTTADVSDPR